MVDPANSNNKDDDGLRDTKDGHTHQTRGGKALVRDEIKKLEKEEQKRKV